MMGLLFFLFSLVDVGHLRYDLVKVGDTKVIIQLQEHGEGKSFVHLHQNERTALKAARTVVKQEGGSLMTLIHSGGRNIVFHLHDKRYEFDPNRIFSDVGIKKTLLQFGDSTPQARLEVKKLADKIKSLLPDGKIIAVHNNETYSLQNYFPGHDMARDAHLLHVNKQHYHRNFYLVTQKHDYTRLKRFNYNSVWQAEDATDDGSLSVFLANRSYVNVEAGYGQLAMQIKMLRMA